MDPQTIGWIGIALMLALIAIGVPIAFAMAVVGVPVLGPSRRGGAGHEHGGQGVGGP